MNGNSDAIGKRIRRNGVVGARWGAALLALSVGLGCATEDGDDDEGDPRAELPIDANVDGVGTVGLRRLTVREYNATVRDLLGEGAAPSARFLPEDRRTPFDNDFTTQTASRVLVEGVEALARDIAARTVADPARRDLVVGCAPSSADDDDCMRSFVTAQGRRMLRRPLTAEEVDAFTRLGLDAAAQTEFFGGVEAVLTAWLQDPAFLYRIETGVPVPGRPGLFRLDGFEVATRMAYLIWGSAPDDGLLDWAESGGLDEAEGRREAATAMLADPRARGQIDRFHAQWLGYDSLSHPPFLTNAMRLETRALVERVIFDEHAAWDQLFLSTDSYIGPTLASYYGIAEPITELGWVDTSAVDRVGILSQGSFLSVAPNVDDTSPTKRGKVVRERLMCQPIPPPPPDVMADTPPTPTDSSCRLDEYRAHREQGTCAGCHALMDEVGFGLERYDAVGVYREFEYLPEGLESNEACAIEGKGEIVGVGTFEGPAGLGRLLVDEGIVQPCVVQQLYGYAMGHAVDDADEPMLQRLQADFAASDYRFDELVLALVADEAFAYRQELDPEGN